jgi:UDP-3-O-[3-hydroxymyristoyl] glucosamine N-acyltransferase
MYSLTDRSITNCKGAKMHNLSKVLSKELAERLYDTSHYGKAVVVTDKPAALLAATRKQWVIQTRKLQHQRASTLDAIKIHEANRQISWRQMLRFSAKPPEDALGAAVTFGTAETFVKFPPMCRTMYITYQFSKEQLYMLTSWMPKGGIVIFYE